MKGSVLAGIYRKLKINDTAYRHRQRQNIMCPTVLFDAYFCEKYTVLFFWKWNLRIILPETSQSAKKQHLHNSFLAGPISRQKLGVKAGAKTMT